MKLKKKSTIYAYLQPYLDAGPEAIEQARKTYWKQYRVNHRRVARNKLKTLEIGFTQNEWKLICKAAKEHKRGRSRFVKQATIAYLQQKFIIPDILLVHEIKSLLEMHLVFIKDKFEERLVPEAIGKLLLLRLVELAEAVTAKLETPQNGSR